LFEKEIEIKLLYISSINT